MHRWWHCLPGCTGQVWASRAKIQHLIYERWASSHCCTLSTSHATTLPSPASSFVFFFALFSHDYVYLSFSSLFFGISIFICIQASESPEREYPFVVTGINITQRLMKLLGVSLFDSNASSSHSRPQHSASAQRTQDSTASSEWATHSLAALFTSIFDSAFDMHTPTPTFAFLSRVLSVQLFSSAVLPLPLPVRVSAAHAERKQRELLRRTRTERETQTRSFADISAGTSFPQHGYDYLSPSPLFASPASSPLSLRTNTQHKRTHASTHAHTPHSPALSALPSALCALPALYVPFDAQKSGFPQAVRDAAVILAEELRRLSTEERQAKTSDTDSTQSSSSESTELSAEEEAAAFHPATLLALLAPSLDATLAQFECFLALPPLQPLHELYCAVFALFDRVWIARRAKYMDFGPVMAQTMQHLEDVMVCSLSSHLFFLSTTFLSYILLSLCTSFHLSITSLTFNLGNESFRF